MEERYENYKDFRFAINKLMEQEKYNEVIKLSLNHQPQFLSLTHIILANAYILRATKNPNDVNKKDAMQSFSHIHLAIKYSPDSAKLFLENDVKSPQDRFCERLANEFIKTNMERYKINLTEEDFKEIKQIAEAFYMEHLAEKTLGCNL